MVRKKVTDTKIYSPKSRDVTPRSKTILQDEIIYAMANTSVILMSMMMGLFTQVLGSTMGAMASGMAEAIGGKKLQTKST